MNADDKKISIKKKDLDEIIGLEEILKNTEEKHQRNISQNQSDIYIVTGDLASTIDVTKSTINIAKTAIEETKSSIDVTKKAIKDAGSSIDSMKTAIDVAEKKSKL